MLVNILVQNAWEIDILENPSLHFPVIAQEAKWYLFTIRRTSVVADSHGNTNPMDLKCLFKISAAMHFVKMSA